MRFYLGSHHATPRWWAAQVPLFVSRRVLTGRQKLPQAQTGWALDSGGFTELNLYGEWRTNEADYIADVLRFEAEIGSLDWVAPMDWMVEPMMLAKTGLTVAEHQERTVSNYLRLREQLGELVIPVLQGWQQDDYHRCWARYEAAGVDLNAVATVGLGSICRRQNMSEAGRIVRSLRPLRLHAFGVKLTGLESFADALVSSDSMSWSYTARREPPIYGHKHKACNNCIDFALRWRQQVLDLLSQTRLEIPCAV